MKHPELLDHQLDQNTLTLTLFIPAALYYFAGHFPGSPILPGVVQLHWAVDYARKYLGVQGQFAGMSAVKFQQIIQPEQTITLELTFDEGKNQLRFCYSSLQGRCSSGRINLVGADV